MNKSLPLAVATANKLEQDIRQSSASCLQSIPVLCRTYDVSRTTMLAAVRILRDKGTLLFKRGSRILIKDRSPVRYRTTLARTLANTIRKNIEDGALKLGKELPKISYYAAACHMSRDAVCEAMALVAEEQLIHKQGRSWMVGPPRIDNMERLAFSTQRDTNRPVVLILVPFYVFWNYYMRHFHARPFLHSVIDELHRCGTEYRVVVAGENDLPPFIPAGRHAITRLIEELGSRYRGMLAATNTQQAGWQRWSDWFASYGRPFLYFLDDTAGAEKAARQQLPSGVFRCFHSESATADVLIEALGAWGHHRIGFLHMPSMDTEDWYAARRTALEEACSRSGAQMGMSLIDIHDMAWHEPRETLRQLSETPDEDGAGSGGHHTATQDTRLPALAALLDRRHEISAVVATNDRIAVQVLLGLETAKIRVPRDLSIISFDNDPAFAVYPLTTIDMGYTRMGYFAAHLLAADIPVRTDRYNNLLCKPYLVDRGTMGMAR
jgi:DNA-binding GntR family transcriptional regulator